MKARSRFSICVNIHPEILIVDEALSVGDRAFRDKCIKKIKATIMQGDITMLFVTHAVETARAFCKRGIVMKAAHRVRRRHRCGDRILQYEILKARVEDGRL